MENTLEEQRTLLYENTLEAVMKEYDELERIARKANVKVAGCKLVVNGLCKLLGKDVPTKFMWGTK